MKIRGLFFGFLLLSSFTVFGQNFNRNDFFEADMSMVDGNYFAAQKIYERLLLSEPDNANLNYLNGYCLINIQGRKKESLEFLEKASPKASAEYKAGSYKETNAPLNVIKYYAMACKLNNNISKAIDLFNQYKATIDPKKKDEIAEVNSQIEACYTSLKLQEEPIYFRTHDVGENLQSNESQIYPVVNQDGTMLFYTVPGKYNKDDIYFSQKENGIWGKPVKITVHLGIKTRAYPSSVSYDNKRLYITAMYGVSTDIYYSEFSRGRWKKMIKLEKPISSKNWDSQAFESSDGRYLYFSSDRKGGEGNMDLYRSEKDSKGKWGKPVNLGGQINTPENELMPMVNADHTKLYFKSEGHDNLGGYDIFFSTKTEDETWSQPVNMGYSINTTDDDIHFMPLSDEIYAYVARQTPETGSRFKLIIVEMFSEKNPRIFDISGMVVLQNGDGIEGTLIEVYSTDTYLNMLSTQPEIYSGNYKFEIPAGAYMINYVRAGYKTHTQLINLPMNNPEGALVINAVLEKEAPIVEEVPVVLAAAVVEESILESVADHEPEPEPEIPTYAEPEPVYVEPVLEATQNYHEELAYEGKYTVQFMAATERVDMETLAGKYPVEIQKGTDVYYRYITGVFNSKAEAENTHRDIAGTKYTDAFIRYHNLDDYLNRAANNPDVVYTIQLMALKEEVAPPELSVIDNVKVSHGEDGWYRYTTGEFMSLVSARHALNALISKGFKDAYLKKITDVSNYR